jgi:hypothetical protein
MVVPPLRLTGVAVCALAIVIPTCLLAIFLGTIILVGIFVNIERRRYILDAASKFICFAGVLARIVQGTRKSTPS